MEADVAADVGRQQAGDLEATVGDAVDEVEPVAAGQHPLAIGIDVQVQVVHRLPYFLRQGIADPAQDLARAVDRGPQRRRIARIQQQEFQHRRVVGLRVAMLEQFAGTDRGDHRPPAEAHRARQVQLQQAADADQARGVLRTTQVAAEPVQVVGDAREHQPISSRSTTQVSLAPPPCDEFTTSEPSVIATRVRPPVVT